MTGLESVATGSDIVTLLSFDLEQIKMSYDGYDDGNNDSSVFDNNCSGLSHCSTIPN